MRNKGKKRSERGVRCKMKRCGKETYLRRHWLALKKHQSRASQVIELVEYAPCSHSKVLDCAGACKVWVVEDIRTRAKAADEWRKMLKA